MSAKYALQDKVKTPDYLPPQLLLNLLFFLFILSVLVITAGTLPRNWVTANGSNSKHLISKSLHGFNQSCATVTQQLMTEHLDLKSRSQPRFV